LFPFMGPMFIRLCTTSKCNYFYIQHEFIYEREQGRGKIRQSREDREKEEEEKNI